MGVEQIALILRIDGGAQTVQEISKLDQELSAVREQIKGINKDSKGSDKGIKDLASELERLAQAGEAGTKPIKKQFQELEQTFKKSPEALKAVKQELESLEESGRKNVSTTKLIEAAQQRLRDSMDANKATVNELAVAERSLREDRKQTNKELNQQIKDLRKFGDEIPTDSIEGLSRRYSELRKEARLVPKEIRQIAKTVDENSKAFGDLAPDTQKAVKAYKAVQKEAKETKQEILDFDKGILDFTSNIGNYASALEGLDLTGIISKGLGAAGIAAQGGGIEDILGAFGLGGLTDAAKILGPAGILATSVIGGAALMGDAIIKLTKQYEELFSNVQKVTGLGGLQLQEVTARIKAISDVLEVDFDRTLQIANNTAQAFGEDFDTVLDKIQLGLLSVAKGEARDEFLDSFREYPQLIENTGLSLDEFTALAINSSKQGIFSDKLLDSIKEVGLSLTEFTKTQKDALSNVLGEEYSKNLERRLREGGNNSKGCCARYWQRTRNPTGRHPRLCNNHSRLF